MNTQWVAWSHLELLTAGHPPGRPTLLTLPWRRPVLTGSPAGDSKLSEREAHSRCTQWVSNPGVFTHSFEDLALGHLLDNQSVSLCVCAPRGHRRPFNGIETFSDERMLWPEPQGCLGQEWWNFRETAFGARVRSTRERKILGMTASADLPATGLKLTSQEERRAWRRNTHFLFLLLVLNDLP